MHNIIKILNFRDIDLYCPHNDCVCIVSNGSGSYAVANFEKKSNKFTCHDDMLETVADTGCCFAQKIEIEGLIRYWAELSLDSD